MAGWDNDSGETFSQDGNTLKRIARAAAFWLALCVALSTLGYTLVTGAGGVLIIGILVMGIGVLIGGPR